MSVINPETPHEEPVEFTPLRRLRYEIEPRPAALGGGWRLHLIAEDPETGAEVEAGGGVFPDVTEPEYDDDPHAAAMEAGQAWLEAGEYA
jgi:hypothetical protein